MDTKTFEAFRALVYEKSGITLGPQKEALVSARVSKRMRALDVPDHRSYLRLVQQDQTGQEIVQLIDAISTNVTSFFREEDHFAFFSEKMAKWLADGQRRFRIWCAAASTGEEPYTIAMTLMEATNSQRCDLRILATDISTRVLGRCLEAEYDDDKVAKIPVPLRKRYFEERRDGNGKRHRVKDELRQLMLFKRLNLAKPPFPIKGPLDVVFCRNVMIYFDNSVRTGLLREVYRILKPGGYLIVGHAESLTGMLTDFKTVQPSIYVKS
jgi:chemotaxis protein methyltransferase CheR